MVSRVRPVDCMSFSRADLPEDTEGQRRHDPGIFGAVRDDIRMPGVCAAMKIRDQNRPISVNKIAHDGQEDAHIGGLIRLSCFFSPRLRDSRAFTPTPVPVATAIMRF